MHTVGLDGKETIDKKMNSLLKKVTMVLNQTVSVLMENKCV